MASRISMALVIFVTDEGRVFQSKDVFGMKDI